MYYGLATGLYAETDYINELGNPVRDPVIQNDDGSYDPASGGLIFDGVLEDGSPNNIRVEGDYFAHGYYFNPHSAFVYDASFVKLREFVLTYSFPRTLLANTFIGGATLSLVGSNLWILHKNLPHSDPEATQSSGNIQGWQSGVLPVTRNFGFTLNVKF
jgi:hypothetical protein